MKYEEAFDLFSTWLGKNMRVKMKDERELVGQFLCTDNKRNIILANAHEYIPDSIDAGPEGARFLGLAMVPGCHIDSMHVDLQPNF